MTHDSIGAATWIISVQLYAIKLERVLNWYPKLKPPYGRLLESTRWSKKVPVLFFEQLRKALADFNNFWHETSKRN